MGDVAGQANPEAPVRTEPQPARNFARRKLLYL